MLIDLKVLIKSFNCEDRLYIYIHTHHVEWYYNKSTHHISRWWVVLCWWLADLHLGCTGERSHWRCFDPRGGCDSCWISTDPLWTSLSERWDKIGEFLGIEWGHREYLCMGNMGISIFWMGIKLGISIYSYLYLIYIYIYIYISIDIHTYT